MSKSTSTANVSRAVLMRTAVHDLNNLLLPILALANELAETLPAGSARSDVEQIAWCAERARELVRDRLAPAGLIVRGD
jgi:signal transduction histidine kinase